MSAGFLWTGWRAGSAPPGIHFRLGKPGTAPSQRMGFRRGQQLPLAVLRGPESSKARSQIPPTWAVQIFALAQGYPLGFLQEKS